MRWLPTFRNMHTGRTCSPHQAMLTRPWLSSTAAYEALALFLLLRPAERLCYYKHKRSQRPSGHVTVDKQVEEACR
jgi:hypothetical protein